MPDDSTATAPDDTSWMDHPTGMEGIPQADFSPRTSAQTLDPSEVEIEGQDKQADQKPPELSASEVEIEQPPASQTAKQPADDSQEAKDMATAPPAWAKSPGAVPQPDMPDVAKGSSQDIANAVKGVPGVGGNLGPDPLTGVVHTEKDAAKTLFEGVSMLGPENFADNSPEAMEQTAVGYKKIADGIMGMASPIIPAELAANPKAVWAIVKGITAGYISGAVAEKAVKLMGFSQAYQDLANTIGFFLPTAAGVLSGATTTKLPFGEGSGKVTDYFRPAGATEPGSGRVSTFTASNPQEFAAGVRAGGKTVGVRIPRRGGFADTQPGAPEQLPGEQGPPPAPQPPPDAAAVTAAQDHAAAAQAVAATDELRTEAERVSNGQPPTPEKPMPAGMDKGILSQGVVSDLSKVAEIAGPEAAPEIVREAHAQMAGWMQEKGQVVLPDGKIEVVDSPKKAATVAASVINDEIDRKQKETDAASKQQAEAQAAQKEQGDQQQATLEQRAKTILAVNPDHPDPTGLLQRNLGVDRPTAEALSRRAQTPAEAQAGGLVGSPTHQVTEEPPAQVDAQLAALKKGTIPVVMLPEGSQYEPELPPGMKILNVTGDVPGAGKYIYDPKKIRPATIKEAAKAGTHGDLLGHVATKEEIPAMAQPTVLQARQNGQPVQESVVDAAKPGQVKAQHEQLTERHPGAEIRAVPPEQVNAERETQHPTPEEANAIQEQGAGEVRKQPGGQEEVRGGEREGVQPGEQGHEVAGQGEQTKEVNTAAIEKELRGAQSKTRVVTFGEKLKPFLDADRAAAKPITDLHRTPTGWLAHPHAHGLTIIHPTEPYAIDFSSHDWSSATEAMRAKAEAQAYAIDHPVGDVFDKIEKPEGDVFDKIAPERQKYHSGYRDEFDKQTSELDKSLYGALHMVSGGGERFAALRATGATDQQMKEAIAREFGLWGSGSGMGEYKGGQNPQWWPDGRTRSKPIQGKALIQAARRVLDIGEPKPPERRQDTERRKQLAELTPEEMRKELSTSTVTGLPNRRAFDDDQHREPAAAVAMSDADGLKAFNDKFGYEAGNELLKAKAEALKAAGVEAYHDKGDEFLYRGKSTADLKKNLENARQILRETTLRVTSPEGEVRNYKGADFSYGTGKDLKAAETRLKQHKAQREAAGERARGELRGITEAGPEPSGEDRGGAAEPKYEFGSTQHNLRGFEPARQAIEALQDEIPDEDLAGDGKDIDIPHVTIRYGIQDDDIEGIRAYLASQKPFTAKLGATDIFPPSKNSDGAAVIMAPVESPDFHRMNAEIEKHGKFTEPSFKEYKPHVTIAYVKPEVAEKYKGNTATEGQTFEVTHAFISDRNGKQIPVELEGGKEPTKYTTLGEAEKAKKEKREPATFELPQAHISADERTTKVALDDGKEQQLRGRVVTFEKFPGHEFVLHEAADYEDAWSLTEPTTGLRIAGPGVSPERVISEAEHKLARVTPERLAEEIAKRAGVAPTPEPGKELTEKPEQPAAQPAPPSQKFAKGDAVTFKDAKGNEREGTVAYNGGIVIRIKGDDGKEYTVGKSKVTARGNTAPQPESLDTASGGRPAESVGELHRAPVAEVPPGVLSGSPAERGTGTSGPSDGLGVRGSAEPVSGAGPRSGSGTGSDTTDDRARPGKVSPREGKKQAARLKALKELVPNLEQNVEDLRGNIDEIQRHIDQSAAGEIDANWIDGLNRMGGTDVETFGEDEADFEWKEPGKYPPGVLRQLQENIDADNDEIKGIQDSIEQTKDEIRRLEESTAEPIEKVADSPAESTIAKAEKERTAPAPARNKDWYAHPADWKPPTNEAGRVDANIAALKLIREIEKTPRKLTDDERLALASYVGWGSLPKVFDPYTAPRDEFDKWRRLNEELRGLISPEEFAAARRSTQNAHYTSPTLVRFMWDIMKRFGFKGGNVIEPSMGTGNFFGMMPKALRANTHAIGNELDPTTFAIAQQLYPSATLYNKDFKELILPDDDIDLAISNVPFGEAIYDPRYPKLKARVHDYFFVKSLDKVKPGGVVAFITSTGTMDKGNDSIRQILASKADLLGAVRLPSSAFEKSAGTSVTTDLILLRKRAPGQKATGPEWMKTRAMELKDRRGHTEQVPVNEYFHEHPEMMLGEPESHSMYGGGVGFSLKAFEDKPIDKLLDGVMQKLPRGVMLPADPTGSKDAQTGATYAPDALKEGAFTVTDKGKVMQRVEGKLVPAEAVAGPDGAPVPAKVERSKALIGLRDELDNMLLEMATKPNDEEGNSAIAKEREKLLKSYQKFVKKYGELHKPPNAQVFEEDPHYPRLLALEHHDKAAKKTTLADIFTKRTIFPRQPLKMLAPDPQDALNQILGERGYPDMDLMARLRGTDVPTVAKEFIDKGLIYRDPLSGNYETRDKYLSGYVRDKLADARKAVAQGNAEYAPNVKALEEVQPKDVPISEIEVKLGATWIPLPAFRDFINDTFSTDGSVTNTAGSWKVSNLRPTAEVSATYGTPRIDAGELMELALNLKEPAIYDYSADTRVLNPDQTALARQKQEQIKEAFNKWAENSAKWAKPLETAYNYAMNNLVLRERDGSHLTLPGLNPAIKMRPHQLSIIWRGIEDGRYGAFHEVGAGKTLEAIGTIMEGRRMGLFNKPMLAVPNHLVEQWRNEFMDAYPGAKLLVPTERDFDAKRRNRLMAKIATGDYDAVVLAHSQFNLMDISAERQLITLNAQMDELEETIRSMQRGGEDKRSVKQMEKSKEKLRTRMDKLRDLKADKTINFDDLGVDALFVDEAHEYKNLAFYTKMTRVSGLSQADAKRATRLKMKTEYLQDQNKGKGVYFLTGTPLQNTMAEQYTMMKYVAPDVLEKAGIRFFDDWAANFGSVRAKAELGADGRSFKIRNKFSRFTNVPELMTMFHSFGDVKTARDLNLPTPKLIGGKPQSQIIEPSEALEAYVQSLIFRARQVAGEVGVKPDPTEDNMLKITSDGRKAATDMRLVWPDAEDDPESKINRMVADVYQKYLEFAPSKATQLVFLDMYRAIDGETGKELINLYHDMRGKWMKAGVPAEHIAIIGDYKTKEARQKLFDQMKAGDVRILLGSTQKMGAGMNVQRLLKWLHHVDNPWRPGDLAQRVGRILRQGNLNEEVGVTHWLTKNSFDTYMLQALESKANFIEQVMNGRYEGRTMEDITGDMSLNLAEMKVATSGNPDVKKKYDLESDRSQLLTLQRGHESQRRSNLQRAAGLRHEAAYQRAQQEKLRGALKAIAAAKGEDGKGYSVQLDGKDYTDRETLGKAIEKMDVPTGNFHLIVNNIGVAAEPFSQRGLPQMAYALDYEDGYHDAPERSMASLIRSVEARLLHVEANLEHSQTVAKSNDEKAGKLDELTKGPFEKQAELERVEAELKEVNQRLGIGPKKDVSELAEADNTPDELEEGEDNEDVDLSEPRPKKGSTELHASVFGLDIAARFLGKQAAAFYKADVGPMLERVGGGAKEAGKKVAAVLYPRLGANQDALDSIMAAKGEMERARFVLEHINNGLEKFFDKMTPDQHIAFIDRYKLGMGQPHPELQKVEDLMRAFDDESLKEAQKYRPTLTAKENHFRVLWKVIPNTKTPGPQAQKGNPTNYRRPYEGDKGFMKRATLETISEGLNYGGVPFTTNPWKLFTMAQASIKKYIAAQEHWANLKSLGLRKFVRLGEPPPPEWVKVDDRIGDVYFKAQSGEGSVHSGRWYLEPTAGRILNNFLSRDLIRDNPIGNFLLLAKNLSTAIELGLSPYHFLFESIEAIGSQFGQGSARVWNMGVRKADSAQALIGLREMGTALASPVLYSRAGGSLLRATANFQEFAKTARGQAFLTKFPDAIHGLDMLFKGGLQFNMNPDYRFDATKSLKASIRDNNYIGAALRVLPAMNHWMMYPLFDVYIPRLKMGFALSEFGRLSEEYAKELSNGDVTELELARKVVDAAENRFGEMNFSNIFWNNTFKSGMQFLFRSVTWKLGNWRGAAQGAGEAGHAFADPLKAMYEDYQQGHARGDWREAYTGKIGPNMAWVLGMGVMMSVMGTVLTRALSGKWPWEYIPEDRRADHSAISAVLYEMMHPRTGRRNPYTGQPERVTLPVGLKDFEHAFRDPKGYIHSSESGTLSLAGDVLMNRDFFGNYVYDPNGSLYQQATDSLMHVLPKPISVQGLTQHYGAQDATSKALRGAGLTSGSSPFDETPLERAITQENRDNHRPMTPAQVKARDAGDRMQKHVSPGELRRKIREGKLSHVEKLFEHMGYADAKHMYDKLATPREKAILGPMLDRKRQSLLRRKGADAVVAAQ